MRRFPSVVCVLGASLRTSNFAYGLGELFHDN
jgi:hypothetical protein